MSDATRAHLCLREHCGQAHHCRYPVDECVCPFCGGEALETIRAERLPGFDEIAAKPAERRQSWTG